MSPAVFIPVAEHTGRISDLTLSLLAKSLDAARSWPEHIGISFNVSPYDIASLDKTTAILGVIRASGISPNRVAMELTETALLRSFEDVSAHMAMVRAMGASISLDDFGTGHSSLSYVHALPLDKIKVDRSFIQNLLTNAASRNVVRSVITLCRDLGLNSVIEGVETQSQLDILDNLGASLIQGYHFSRPIPADQVMSFIANTLASNSISDAAMPTDAIDTAIPVLI